ncbi:unnamed protein product [Bursaphelenchus xylophilus]|uniref:(pine wood nematode) hypothetical protein n=1 Tax=Bursaphelenchus xylophilus TaxID=6326 RepID=A0A1I7S2W6_BURXY|nr:unnamed protein product [Bursaphelenchus xylophilus]CAG9116009.1 unnamed protein product [Bursaphelenchus xylophilus]
MSFEDIIGLKLSCSDLPVVCTSGSQIRIFAMIDGENQRFTQIGQTELLTSRNPSFKDIVPVVFVLEQNQVLKFSLFLGEKEIGSVETGLKELVMNSPQLYLPMNSTGDQWDPDDSPLLGIEVEESEQALNGTKIQLKACHLQADEVINAAPYFTLSRIHSSIEEFPTLLYRSEAMNNTTNPKWTEFVVPTKALTSLTPSVLEIAVYHFINNKSEDYLIGKFTITFFQLLNGSLGNKFMLHSQNGKKRENVYVEVVKFESVPKITTFVGAIRAGLKLHFTVAIDFTANNGGQNEPDSLHFVHPHYQNFYSQALYEMSTKICQIDKLQRLSLLGFGAKIPPRFEFSPLFSLTGDLNNSIVRGTDNIMNAYRRTVMSVQPYAPTNYVAPIHHIIKMAKVAKKTGTKLYFVVIILTNGAIKNSKESMDMIVSSSHLPISIVFVAIGNEKHPIGAGDHTRITSFIDPTAKSSENVPLKRQNVIYHEFKTGKPFAGKCLKEVNLQGTQWLQSN